MHELQGQQPSAGEGRRRGPAAAAAGQMEVWLPMPTKPNPFVPPNKAHTKLSDVLAKHKGQPNWKEVVVHDHLFHAEYISMAAGAKNAAAISSGSSCLVGRPGWADSVHD